ncbi:MAG: DNA-binding protein [Pseudomonadota bacterium]|nr:DNA-binding protein [Pseudomonadota bacterium]
MTTPTTSRGITETDVWRAADALLLEGARPTIERIRTKIGRGSPNTVSPYLETYFRSLGARIADPMAFSAPPALPDPIAEAAKHFWEAALTAARAEQSNLADQALASLDKIRNDLESERIQLREYSAKITAQSEAKEAALQLLHLQASDLQSRVDSLTKELSQSKMTIENLRSEVSQAAADRQQLQLKLDTERVKFEASRDEQAVRMEAHQKLWATQIDDARQAAKQQRDRHTQLERETLIRIDDLTRSLADANLERNQLSTQRVAMESEISHLRTEQSAAIHTLKEFRDHADQRETSLVRQLEGVQSQFTEALQRLDIKDREHGVLLRSLVAKNEAPKPTRYQRRSRT